MISRTDFLKTMAATMLGIHCTSAITSAEEEQVGLFEETPVFEKKEQDDLVFSGSGACLLEIGESKSLSFSYPKDEQLESYMQLSVVVTKTSETEIVLSDGDAFVVPPVMYGVQYVDSYIQGSKGTWDVTGLVQLKPPVVTWLWSSFVNWELKVFFDVTEYGVSYEMYTMMEDN